MNKKDLILVEYNYKQYYWVDTIPWECNDQILVILVDCIDGTTHFTDLEKIRVVI